MAQRSKHQLAGACVAAFLVAITAVGFKFGAVAAPEQKSFVAVCATLWIVCELLTALLLFSQFSVGGKLGRAIVAAAYAFTGLMTIPYLVFFPGVFATADPHRLQLAVWFWIVWHLAFPLTIVAAHCIDGTLTSKRIARSRIGLMTVAIVGLATVCAVAAFGLCYSNAARLPVFVLAGGKFSPVYRLYAAPAIVATNAVALAVVGLRGRRLSPFQVWLGVALLTMLLDGLLNAGSPARYSVAWYAGKFEALLTSSAVLIMLQIEAAIMYRQFHDLSKVDPLTGLANRRGLEELLWNARASQKTRAAGVAMLVVDVDHFKAYNDRYGHAAGDVALATVGVTLRRSVVRATDIVARYGGEEFLVVLSDVTLAEAQLVGERIQGHIATSRIRNEDAPTGVLTVSIGIAHHAGNAGVIEADLFALADRALYEAKGGGRNRLVLRSAA